jgi:hypothetical protein
MLNNHISPFITTDRLMLLLKLKDILLVNGSDCTLSSGEECYESNTPNDLFTISLACELLISVNNSLSIIKYYNFFFFIN